MIQRLVTLAVSVKMEARRVAKQFVRLSPHDSESLQCLQILHNQLRWNASVFG
jgi:hypothetical protein